MPTICVKEKKRQRGEEGGERGGARTHGGGASEGSITELKWSDKVESSPHCLSYPKKKEEPCTHSQKKNPAYFRENDLNNSKKSPISCP